SRNTTARPRPRHFCPPDLPNVALAAPRRSVSTRRRVCTGLAKGDRVRWIAFALLAGCSGTHPPLHPVVDGSATDLSPDLSPEPPHTNAVLELGGVDAMGQWVALIDGQDVTLVEGAQGGFHVWLKYRVTEMGSGNQHLERTAHRAEDGQLVLRTDGNVVV